MTTTTTSNKTRTSAGDAAARGLIAGLVAGVAMGIFLVAAGLVGGVGPTELLSRFGAGQVTPIAGAFSHLAVSAVYGAAGGVLLNGLRGRAPGPAWLLGLGYGLILYLFAQVALRGAASPMLEIPTLHFLAAHLLYGLVLGWQEGKG